jgi:hypothetical protein
MTVKNLRSRVDTMRASIHSGGIYAWCRPTKMRRLRDDASDASSIQSAVRILVLSLGVGLISGCAGITPLQDSVNHFDQSVHAAATAETTLIGAAQKLSIEKQFYSNANAYISTSKTSTGEDTNFDLRALYRSQVLTSAQVQSRAAMMDALVLYADKMQALANGDDVKTLETNSTTAAENVKKLLDAKKITLAGGTAEEANAAYAAIQFIANWLVDKERSKTIQKAAQDAVPHIGNLVAILSKENSLFNDSINSDLGLIEGKLRQQIINLKSASDVPMAACDKTALQAEAFFAILQAREYFAGESALEPQMKDDERLFVDFAKPVNDALAAIEKANTELAKDGSASTLSAIAQELSARAADAIAFYKGLPASK